MPRKLSMAIHNGPNYDYNFIIRELPEEFEKQLTCLGGNTKKYTSFSIPIEKEVTRIEKKNGEGIKKTISYRLELLVMQDLWQAHSQISSIIFLKEFLKLNENMDIVIKMPNLRN